MMILCTGWWFWKSKHEVAEWVLGKTYALILAGQSSNSVRKPPSSGLLRQQQQQ